MKIVITHVNDKIFKRNNIYVGKVMNQQLDAQRKILCRNVESCTMEDLLFDSPNYTVNQEEKMFISDLVNISKFLSFLGYQEELDVWDIKKIYYQLLLSPTTLHKYHDFFGAKKCDRGYKGNYVYLENLICRGYESFENFSLLESSIELPIKPSKLEKNENAKSFQKKIFFIG